MPAGRAGVIAKPSVGGAWTPASLTNLLVWWDASDASTFTYSSGSVVAQWADKSGNARHLAQATVASQPVRTAILNGLPGVTFDGVDDTLTADATTDAIVLSPWTLWCVIRLGTTANYDRILSVRQSATGSNDYQSPNGILVYRNSATSSTYTIAAHSAGTVSADSTGISTAMIVGSRMDGTNLYSSVNGTESAGTAVTAPGGVRYLRMGGLSRDLGNPPQGGANFLTGDVFEMFVCNSNVTATNAITYLQAKWAV